MTAPIYIVHLPDKASVLQENEARRIVGALRNGEPGVVVPEYLRLIAYYPDTGRTEDLSPPHKCSEITLPGFLLGLMVAVALALIAWSVCGDFITWRDVLLPR